MHTHTYTYALMHIHTCIHTNTYTYTQIVTAIGKPDSAGMDWPMHSSMWFGGKQVNAQVTTRALCSYTYTLTHIHMFTHAHTHTHT
jgi:hypothetical protein